MRRALRLLLALLVLLVGVIAAGGTYLIAGGGFATYAKASLIAEGGRSAAPRWTSTCRSDGPGIGAADECGAVRGSVVYVQRVDPDGDGDMHIVLLAGTSVRLVKLPLRYRPVEAPRVGTRILAGGWLTRGASGRAEIDAQRLCPVDSRSSACPATLAFG